VTARNTTTGELRRVKEWSRHTWVDALGRILPANEWELYDGRV
jgi:hypothetical protein